VRCAGRGFWSDVPEKQWNSWVWQLQNRITTLEQLQRLMPTLTPEEYAGTTLANRRLALAITPYFFNLIDPADENCPIRRQVVPRLEETHSAPWEMSDPCGEDSHSPLPGLVHRYPDRVLFLVTDRCAAYCRYCTRSRLVSNATGYDFHPQFDKQIEYIRNHPEVRDVLLSGGDPLLFSDERLQHLLSQLRAIPHLENLRGHTTGYAVPQYVIDAPNGGGKVPVNPDYILSRDDDRVIIRNYEGKVFEYPEAADGTPLVPAPTEIEEPELV